MSLGVAREGSTSIGVLIIFKNCLFPHSRPIFFSQVSTWSHVSGVLMAGGRTRAAPVVVAGRKGSAAAAAAAAAADNPLGLRDDDLPKRARRLIAFKHESAASSPSNQPIAICFCVKYYTVCFIIIRDRTDSR